MSFLFGDTSNIPESPPKPLGADTHRAATSEQARPVPYFIGTQRLGVTFISDLFHVRTESVTRTSGKQKTKVGSNYYASFAALIGIGPLYQIKQLFLNGESVWTGSTTFGGSDYLDLTVTGVGVIRFYAGTETQAPDAYLIAQSGVDHPAYRGMAYLVAHQIFLGFNQTSVQNLEVIAERQHTPAWFSANNRPAAIGLDANPVAVAADWLQHPRHGLAVRDERLDTAALDAAATRLRTEKIGVSPVLTRAQEARQLLVQLCEYADAFPLIGADGRLSLGLARAPADPGSLPVVDETQMSRKPAFNPEDWSGAYDETRLRFTNAATGYKEEGRTRRDAAALHITGEPNPQTLDRPWITSATLAESMVTAASRAAAIPAMTGQIGLRKTPALFAALAPGALFRLNYGPRNLAGLVCRVTERAVPEPARPEFEISFKVDRSYLFPAPPAGQEEGGGGEPPAPPPPLLFAAARIVELPPALCPDGKLSLTVLAARPSERTTGCAICLQKNYAENWGGPASPESYELLAAHDQFAQHGTLQTDYPALAVTGTIDTQLGLTIQLDGPDVTLDEAAPFDALADDLLVFIDEEILSVHRVTLIGSGLYKLHCIRGRMASRNGAHAAGAEVFIAERADLRPLQHPLFQVHNTATFKLAPVEGLHMTSLADVVPLDCAIAGRIFTSTPPANLRVNGDLLHPIYAAGQGLTIEWTLTQPGADLAQAGLYKTGTMLEFLDGAQVKGTKVIAGAATQAVIANAELVSLLGGTQISFTLRAKTRIEGDFFIAHSDPLTLFVQKL